MPFPALFGISVAFGLVRAEWRGALGLYQPQAFVGGGALPAPSLTRSEGNGDAAHAKRKA